MMISSLKILLKTITKLIDKVLPKVTEEDDGKILKVVDGEWRACDGVTDTSLTKSGIAADAKVTGEKVKWLENSYKTVYVDLSYVETKYGSRRYTSNISLDNIKKCIEDGCKLFTFSIIKGEHPYDSYDGIRETVTVPISDIDYSDDEIIVFNVFPYLKYDDMSYVIYQNFDITFSADGIVYIPMMELGYYMELDKVIFNNIIFDNRNHNHNYSARDVILTIDKYGKLAYVKPSDINLSSFNNDLT